MAFINEIKRYILWIYFILSWQLCASQAPVSFFYTYDGETSWRTANCRNLPDLRRVKRAAFTDRTMDETCTCLLYNNNWQQGDQVVLDRYDGRWITLATYEYNEWSQLEGGALRIFIENARVRFYLNNREDSYDYEVNIVSMEMEENTLASPQYENTTKSHVQTHPKVSMDTDPERHIDDESGNESQTTDDDSSDPGSPTYANVPKDPEGQSLHVEDLEFVGKKGKGFRKVKKHKARRTTILKKDKGEKEADKDSDDAKAQEGSGTESTEVNEPESDNNNESSYADIDLKSLAKRQPKTADESDEKENLTYADIDFS